MVVDIILTQMPQVRAGLQCGEYEVTFRVVQDSLVIEWTEKK